MSKTEIRFGQFAFFPDKLELYKSGYPIKLPQQSAQLLRLLLDNPGQVVTREQMRDVIWPEGTHVEFDFGLNTAINRIRKVLDDSARNPRFVETLHRTGYRFIATCEVLTDAEAPIPPVPLKTNRKLPAFLALASIFLLAIIFRDSIFVSKPAATGSPLRSSILLPLAHLPIQLRIAPAADRLAYLSSGKVFQRRLDRDESIPVEGSEGAVGFEYSPNGNRLAILKPDGISTLDDSGLRPLVRFSQPVELRTATWSKNGYLYYSTDDGPTPAIYRVNTAGGQPELIKPGKPNLGRIEFPMVQQDLGSHLLYSTALSPRNRSIFAWSAGDGEVELVRQAMGAKLLSTGHLLYLWANDLFGILLDSAPLQIRGTPAKLIEGVRSYAWAGPALDVSASGTLVYLPQPPLEQRDLVIVDENGTITSLGLPKGEYEQVRISPDESKLATVKKESSSRWVVSIYDLKSKSWTTLLELSLPSPRVVWGPDSQTLVAGLLKGDAEFVNLYKLNINTPTVWERIAEQPNFGQFPTFWSEKENVVLFVQGLHPARRSDLYEVSLHTNQIRPVLESPGWDLDAKLSPDGRWLSYTSETKDGFQVFVRPYKREGPPVKVSHKSARGALWSKQGDKLWYRVMDEKGLYEVKISDGKPVSKPIKKFPGVDGLFSDIWTSAYDISPSGKLLTMFSVPKLPEGRIEVISNWFSELNRAIPLRR